MSADLETVAALGAEIAARHGGADLDPELAGAMRRQAAKRVGLQFLERLRPEQRFGSVAELATQIRRDVESARAVNARVNE